MADSIFHSEFKVTNSGIDETISKVKAFEEKLKKIKSEKNVTIKAKGLKDIQSELITVSNKFTALGDKLSSLKATPNVDTKAFDKKVSELTARLDKYKNVVRSISKDVASQLAKSADIKPTVNEIPKADALTNALKEEHKKAKQIAKETGDDVVKSFGEIESKIRETFVGSTTANLLKQDYANSFNFIRTNAQQTFTDINKAMSTLKFDKKLGAQLFGKDTLARVDMLEQKLIALKAHAEKIKPQTVEDDDLSERPEQGYIDKQVLKDFQQARKEYFEADKALTQTITKDLVTAFRKNAKVLGTSTDELYKQSEAATVLNDDIRKLKTSAYQYIQNIGAGGNILKNTQSLYATINKLRESGANVEANILAKEYSRLNVTKRLENSLAKLQAEYAGINAINGNIAEANIKQLSNLREQHTIATQIAMTGGAKASAKAMDSIGNIEDELAAQQAFSKLRESITKVNAEIRGGLKPSVENVTASVQKLKTTGTDGFNTLAKDGYNFNRILVQLKKDYTNFAKSDIGKNDLEGQEERLKKLKNLYVEIAEVQGFNKSAEKQLGITDRFITKQETKISNERLANQFAQEYMDQYANLLILQGASVKASDKYTTLQNRYIKNGGSMAKVNQSLLTSDAQKLKVMDKMQQGYALLKKLATETDLMPAGRLEMLKQAQQTLKFIKDTMLTMSKNKYSLESGDTISFAGVNKKLTENQKEIDAVKEQALYEEKLNAAIDARQRVLDKIAESNKRIKDTYKESLALIEKGLLTSRQRNDLMKQFVDLQKRGINTNAAMEQVDSKQIASMAGVYNNLQTAMKQGTTATGKQQGLIETLELLKEVGAISGTNTELMHKFLNAVGLSSGTPKTAVNDLRTAIEKVSIELYESKEATKGAFTVVSPEDRKKMEALSKTIATTRTNLHALGNEAVDALDNADPTKVQSSFVKMNNHIQELVKSMQSLGQAYDSNESKLDKQGLTAQAVNRINLEKTKELSGVLHTVVKDYSDVERQLAKVGVTVQDMATNPAKAMALLGTNAQGVESIMVQLIASINKLQSKDKDLKLLGNLAEYKDIEQVIAGIQGYLKKFKQDAASPMQNAIPNPAVGAEARKIAEKKVNDEIKARHRALINEQSVYKNLLGIVEAAKQANTDGIPVAKQLQTIFEASGQAMLKVKDEIKQYLRIASDVNEHEQGRIAALNMVKDLYATINAYSLASGKAPLFNMDSMDAMLEKLTASLGSKPTNQLELLNKAANDASISLDKLAVGLKEVGSDPSNMMTYIERLNSVKIASQKVIKAKKDLLISNEYLEKSSEDQRLKLAAEISTMESVEKHLKRIDTLKTEVATETMGLGLNIKDIGTDQFNLNLHAAAKNQPKEVNKITKALRELEASIKAITNLTKNNVSSSIFDNLANSGEKLTDVIKKVNKSLDKVHTKSSRLAANEAGGNVFDVFRMRWFVQLRMYWSMYAGLMQLMQGMTQYQHIMSVMAGVTQAFSKDVDSLNKKFLRLGENMNIELMKIGEAGLEIAKAGFSARETLNIIETAAQLAQATKASLTVVGDIVTTMIRAWGVSVGEASRISNLLFNTVSTSKASLEGLQQTMSYLSGIAPQANLSMQETLGAVGTLANAGLSMSKVGTYMRQVINDLMNPTEKLTNILVSLGVDLADVNPRFNDMTSIFKTLHDAGMDVSQAFEGMSVRAANAFSIMLSKTDELKRYTKDLNIMGGMANAVDLSSDTIASSLTKLKNLLLELFVLGEESALGDTAVGMIKGFTELVKKVRAVFEAFSDASKAQKKLFSGVGKIFIYVSVFGVLGAAIAGAVASLTLLFGLLATSGIAIAPIVAIFAGLGAAIAAVSLATEDASATFAENIESMVNNSKKLKSEIAEMKQQTANVRTDTNIAHRVTNIQSVLERAKENDTMSKSTVKSGAAVAISALQLSADAEVKKLQENIQKAISEGLVGNPSKEQIAKMGDLLFNMLEDVKKRIYDTSGKLNTLTDKGSSAYQAQVTDKQTSVEINNIATKMISIADSLKENVVKNFELYNKTDENNPLGKYKLTLSPSAFGFSFNHNENGNIAPFENISEDVGKIEKFIAATTKFQQLVNSNPGTIVEAEPKALQASVKAVETLMPYLPKIYEHMDKLQKVTKSTDEKNKIDDLRASLLSAQQQAEISLPRVTQLIDKLNTGEQRPFSEAIDKLKKGDEKDIQVAIDQNESQYKSYYKGMVDELANTAKKVKLTLSLTIQKPSAAEKKRIQKEINEVLNKTEGVFNTANEAFPEKGIGALSADVQQKLYNTIKQAWDMSYDAAKKISADGIVGVEKIAAIARDIAAHSKMSVQSAAQIGNASKKGAQYIKDITKLDDMTSYDDLLDKLDLATEKYNYMKTAAKNVFDSRAISESGKNIRKLVKEQWKYVSSILKTKLAIDTASSSYDTFMRQLKQAQELSDTSNYVNLGEAMSNAFSDVKKQVATSTASLESLDQQLQITAKQTEHLKDSMAAKSAWTSFSTNAVGKLATVQASVKTLTDTIVTMQDSIRSFYDEMNTGQSAFNKKLMEYQRVNNVSQPERYYDKQSLLIEQESYQQQMAPMYVQGIGEIQPTIDSMISAVQDWRDTLISYAIDQPRTASGMEAYNTAVEVNDKLTQLQNIKLKMEEIRHSQAQAAREALVKNAVAIREIVLEIGKRIDTYTQQITARNNDAKAIVDGAGAKGTELQDSLGSKVKQYVQAADKAGEATDEWTDKLNDTTAEAHRLGSVLAALMNDLKKANVDLNPVQEGAFAFFEKYKDIDASFAKAVETQFDTYAEAINTSVMTSLRGLAGEDVDLEQALYDMNWKIIESWVNSMIDAGINQLGQMWSKNMLNTATSEADNIGEQATEQVAANTQQTAADTQTTAAQTNKMTAEQQKTQNQTQHTNNMQIVQQNQQTATKNAATGTNFQTSVANFQAAVDRFAAATTVSQQNAQVPSAPGQADATGTTANIPTPQSAGAVNLLKSLEVDKTANAADALLDTTSTPTIDSRSIDGIDKSLLANMTPAQPAATESADLGGLTKMASSVGSMFSGGGILGGILGSVGGILGSLLGGGGGEAQAGQMQIPENASKEQLMQVASQQMMQSATLQMQASDQIMLAAQTMQQTSMAMQGGMNSAASVTGMGGALSGALGAVGGTAAHFGTVINAFAEGGINSSGVVTKGNKHADSTAAFLTKGEGVLNEPITRKLGVSFVRALNQGNIEGAIRSLPSTYLKSLSDATQARDVGTSNIQNNQPAPIGQNKKINIQNITDPRLFQRYITSPDGVKTIKNVLTSLDIFGK